MGKIRLCTESSVDMVLSTIMRPKVNFAKRDLVVVCGCVAFAVTSFVAIGSTGRERAKRAVCQSNLRQLGRVQAMFLDDNDGRYPYAWGSLVVTEFPYAGYPRFCRWHDVRYPPDGPLFLPYLEDKHVLMCPTFHGLARTEGQRHPAHDLSIPVEPQYSYSMNAYLG